MKNPILMSRDNPDGAKLEDLLEQVLLELEAKNAMLLTTIQTATKPAPLSTKTAEDALRLAVDNNHRVIELLREARRIQTNTMAAFDQLGPNKGPTAPRI